LYVIQIAHLRRQQQQQQQQLVKMREVAEQKVRRAEHELARVKTQEQQLKKSLKEGS
jgi:septal ring factor EnvC (AmiA/AmiB activator)